MRERLIVSTSAGRTDGISKSLLTNYFLIRGWQVWHWQEDLWLVSGEAVYHPVDVHALVIDLGQQIPGLKNNLLIIRVEGSSPFNGYQQVESWEWMDKFWGPERG